LLTIKRRKVNWIGHILRRNCMLRQVIDGKIEGKGRRRRRHKQVLNDLKEKILEFEKEALDRSLWRTHFGRGYGPVVRQTT
jgi:hypothetical protein